MAWHSLVSSVFLLSITNVVCHPLHSDGHSLQRTPMPWTGLVFPELRARTELFRRMTQVVASTQTIYTRTSTGPVTIAETSPEGQFILLENTSSGRFRKSVNLTNWTLQNSVDDKLLQVYTFKNVVIQPTKELKIWAGDYAGMSSSNELVASDIKNWGTGSSVITQLLNEDNEEKARFTRKTTYLSES